MLDKDSGIPLYLQIVDELKQRITSGELKPGDQMPTEAELLKMYGVSRFTVRQTFYKLLQDGLIVKNRGKGTFVAYPKFVENLPHLVSFSEEMEKLGKKPSTDVLSVSIVGTPPQIGEIMERTVDEKCLRIERLRKADGVPLSILIHFIPQSLGVDPRDDFTGSLYELYLNKYHFHIVRGDQIIEAVSANANQAKLLRVPKNSPLLLIRRITVDNQENLIEYVEGYYPADRYSYKISLFRKK